ncbi:TD and POZ domain-containing protein 3 [Nephila pilipes]|uniref:TD and POZ domain-containing protein 3 n=1 Tax=Nephila pilipes TaxID=299642 RepID=A0A8X6TCP3_NEPPI|nr:TD and POZ domain-containing protein 3 [Nephila pilipes]
MNSQIISEKKNFSFTWVIENFSYCWQKKDEEIRSPAFIVETMAKTKWRLILYPKGLDEDDVQEDFISFYLERQEDSKGPANFTIFYEFSFVGADGSLLVSTELLENSFQKNDKHGCKKFVKRSEVFRIRRKDFLSEDVLIARCRLWNAVRHVTKDGLCTARTRIGLERKSFLWNIKKFSSFQKKICLVNSASEWYSIMKVNFLATGKQTRGTPIQVEVSSDNQKLKFFTIRLYLLQTSGNKTEGLRDEFTFDKHAKTVLFSLCISKEILMENKNLYLPNDILTLQCECAYTTGIAWEGIETISYGYLASVQEVKIASNYLEYEKTSLDLTRILQEDLYTLFKENLLSDTKLSSRTGRTIPAHKSILSSRSPVFKAMFVNDMKEKSSECVSIEDLDDDTVQRMLLFLYTAIVEDLEWKSASCLYVAADKYKILSLKATCSSFLKNNLCLHNACELLILADMQQDQDLKSVVQKFILKHGNDIVNSEEWQLMMETNPKLAANTLCLKFKTPKCNLDGDHLESEKTSLDLTKVLQENLKTFYRENILCDTNLKTATGTFLTHKNILSARSPVFKAMFTNNMKEKSSECVCIEDLDDDTVERMLLYLYTAAVEDLQWESAYELYAAADKYEILGLKSMCSSFLKNNLSPENACDLLIVADMHLDQYLKSVVQDYILNHKDVFSTNEWKLFMKTNVQLAADLMYIKCKE